MGVIDEVPQAERLLVLTHFKDAEQLAFSALQQLGAELAPDASLIDRAACVHLQVLFELDRFSEALPVLKDAYGGLAGINCDVLLLWAALALDARQETVAEETLRTYLQQDVVRDESATAGYCRGRSLLGREQYASACQLYAEEVLAKGCARVDDAVRWVEGKAPHLTQRRRSAILDALEALRPPPFSGRPAKPVEGEIRPETARTSSAQLPRQPPRSRLQSDKLRSDSGPASSSAAPDSPDMLQRSWEWLAGAATTVSDTAGELWHKSLGLDSKDALSPAQIGYCCAAAVILYAALAERKALARSGGRLLEAVEGSVTEVGRMALSQSINPLSRRTS